MEKYEVKKTPIWENSHLNAFENGGLSFFSDIK